MAAQPGFSKINLVPQDEFEKSTIGKILKWALTAGKSIVIMTEFVVILAFLSRFKLDRDLNDLNEVIDQKVEIVKSYVETEEQMRRLQERAGVIQKAEGLSVEFDKWWSDLVAITPRDVRYSSIDISKEQLDLEGLSSSDVGLSALISEIKGLSGVSGVNVSEIIFDQKQGGVSFSLTARLATEKKANE